MFLSKWIGRWWQNDVAVLTTTALLGSIVCAALMLLCGGGNGAAFWDFPLDDAWIHMVYVRGWLTSGYPSYNPGVAESGFSSPLWLIVTMPAFLIGNALGALPLWIKYTSVVFGAVTALGVARLTMHFTGNRRDGIMAQVLLFLSPLFAFSMASAMEVTLAAAAIVFALLKWMQQRIWQAGCLLALAALARPEAVCVAMGIGVVSGVWPRFRPAGKWWGHVLPLVVPVLVAFSIWGGYNVAVTGYPLPNTFYVKAGFSPMNNLQLIKPFLQSSVLPLTFWGTAVLTIGIFLNFRVFNTGTQRPFALILVAICIVSITAVFASRPLLPNITFYQYRYYIPFVPPLFAVGAVMVSNAVLSKRLFKIILTGMAVLPFVVTCIAAYPAQLNSYQSHCEEVRTVHTLPAKFIRDHYPNDHTLAVEGAGAMAFFSQKYVVDLNGLNTHTIAHSVKGTGLLCTLAVTSPRLVAVPSTWHRFITPVFRIHATQVFTYPQSNFTGTEGPLHLHIYETTLKSAVGRQKDRELLCNSQPSPFSGRSKG
ncbi:MAG: hypothetical protein JXR76_18615 [Deltaproteobacteria bacterium]|nr:hypothetical protein [Deltaproteobacteria bacterium]